MALALVGLVILNFHYHIMPLPDQLATFLDPLVQGLLALWKRFGQPVWYALWRLMVWLLPPLWRALRRLLGGSEPPSYDDPLGTHPLGPSPTSFHP